MIFYLIYLENIQKGYIENDVFAIADSFKRVKDIALKYYNADFNRIKKKNGKTIPMYRPIVRMWDTLGERDGGSIIGELTYDEKSKAFIFDEMRVEW